MSIMPNRDVGETVVTVAILPWLCETPPACPRSSLTYRHDVSDVDVGKLVEFHKSHGRIATVIRFRRRRGSA